MQMMSKQPAPSLKSDYESESLHDITAQTQEWFLSVLRGIAAWPDPWIDLKRACIMKGVAYNSLKGAANYWKRPNNGVPDGIVSGRDMWRPETIKRWITQTDSDLKQSAREGGMYDTDQRS
jgi:hypothetical protein